MLPSGSIKRRGNAGSPLGAIGQYCSVHLLRKSAAITSLATFVAVWARDDSTSRFRQHIRRAESVQARWASNPGRPGVRMDTAFQSQACGRLGILYVSVSNGRGAGIGSIAVWPA